MKYVTDDAWKVEVKSAVDESSQSERCELSEGQNTIHSLPGLKDGKMGAVAPFARHSIHSTVGTAKKLLTCGKDHRGNGDCCLCDKIDWIRSINKPSDTRKADKLQPQKQMSFQIACEDNDGTFREPFLWSISSGGARCLSIQILGLPMHKKNNFLHPKKGYDLNIERTGTSFRNTRYSRIIPDNEPTEAPEDILARIKPLDELVFPYSKEGAEAAFNGEEYIKSSYGNTSWRIDAVRMYTKRNQRKYYKFKEGENVIRILPEIDDDELGASLPIESFLFSANSALEKALQLAGIT